MVRYHYMLLTGEALHQLRCGAENLIPFLRLESVGIDH